MLKRTDPSIDMHKAVADAQAKKAEARKSLEDANWPYIEQIMSSFKGTTDVNKQNDILAKAINLGLVDKSVTKDNFVKSLGNLTDKPSTAKLEELAKFASSK